MNEESSQVVQSQVPLVDKKSRAGAGIGRKLLALMSVLQREGSTLVTYPTPPHRRTFTILFDSLRN
jgi:hypothetical protein